MVVEGRRKIRHRFVYFPLGFADRSSFKSGYERKRMSRWSKATLAQDPKVPVAMGNPRDGAMKQALQ
uniref:Uncharacterized protein n=1 Tax=Candidatus Kentrum sp. UNK TaxID=2126344 RepID=A0A451AYM8_9GAMM|nr:MAG: hypothetical protein BECKUNK1418G_GA0071005_104818 [Candidatus Kentron sp. UNK]VFK71155.1 MAG: hypothetical protein BECKUNK1418H_GA0071006_105219 [Candidatus Kentron sp. UNK]